MPKWLVAIHDEHLRCWPRLAIDRAYDAIRSVPNNGDSRQQVGLSGENVLKHVAFADYDRQMILYL